MLFHILVIIFIVPSFVFLVHFQYILVLMIHWCRLLGSRMNSGRLLIQYHQLIGRIIFDWYYILQWCFGYSLNRSSYIISYIINCTILTY